MLLRILSATLLLAIGSGASAAQGERRLPNVIFLIADDLGYRDLGCYGQDEIRTPNVDRLAAEGMRFTQHYSGSPVCAPARCVLMTGKHPGHAHIRSNSEVQPEGQRPIPAAEVTLAELFKAQGYATGGFGKWGLGFPGSEGDPLNQGFDRFFGYNCQRHAHSYYPTYLWDNDRRVPVDNPEVPVYEKLPEGADPNDPANYERYKGKTYAPDLYSEQALHFIRDNRDRPFFLYYPTVVPHVALQVPDDSLAEYLGKWDDPPYPGGKGYVPNFTPKATYAAMITRMDREIGRMMALVSELGLEEETIFIFTSDNGAVDDVAGVMLDAFDSNGELREGKRFIYEGGIRIPAVVKWKGRIAPGSVADRVTGFEDWMPTLMELIGAGSTTPEASDGISFAPTLLGRTQEPRPFLYREYFAYGGQQAVRIGDWKGVRRNLRGDNASLKVELYNLARDPGEYNDVSAQYPKIVAQIEQVMKEQRFPSELFPIPILDQMAQN